MKRQVSLLLLLCILLTASLVQAADSITVTVMSSLAEFPDGIVEEFNKTYPNIDVEFLETDLDRLTSMIAAGSPPNLARTTSAIVAYYIARDLVVPLDDYIAESDLIRVDDLEPVVDYYRYDIEAKTQGAGLLYGLPKDYSYTMDYFYRKDLYEEAGIEFPSETEPVTYEEFYQNLEKLAVREGDRTIRWGADGMLSSNYGTMLEVLLAQSGQSFYEDNMKKVNLVNNPEAVKIAKFLYDLAKNRLVQSAIDPAESWLGPNLGTESPRMAIYQYGYWAGALYNDSPVRDQIGYAPGPIWGDKALNSGTATGMVILDSGDDAVNEAAWRFLEYYMAGKPAEDRTKTGWGLPILKSMRALVPQEHPLDKARLAVTLAQLDAGLVHIVQGNPWAMDPITSIWVKYWGEVLAENMSFDDFLATVEMEVNNLILDGVYTIE